MLNVHPMGPSLSSTATAAEVYRSVHLAMGCLWTRIKTPELPSRHDRWPLYANKNSWDSLRNLSTILCRACIYQCRPINFNNAADNLVVFDTTTSSAAPEHCPLGKAKSGEKQPTPLQLQWCSNDDDKMIGPNGYSISIWLGLRVGIGICVWSTRTYLEGYLGIEGEPAPGEDVERDRPRTNLKDRPKGHFCISGVHINLNCHGLEYIHIRQSRDWLRWKWIGRKLVSYFKGDSRAKSTFFLLSSVVDGCPRMTTCSCTSQS